MSKTLRHYSVSSAVSTALTMLSGKNKRKTVVVEGVNDVRFFNQWFGDSDKVRFISVGDKSLVIDTYNQFIRNGRALSRKCMLFCVDIDWDSIHGNVRFPSEYFLTNSYCLLNNNYYFNDMECFLLNTSAIKKLLANYDFDMSDGRLEQFLSSIELASRKVGKYRAADEIVRKKFQLRNSVLNGVDELRFFDCQNITTNEQDLRDNLSSWSNYPEHVDDLITEADNLDGKYPAAWALSRGHDITSMISEYLRIVHQIRSINSSQIEKELRFCCEQNDFLNTPMYEKLRIESLV